LIGEKAQVFDSDTNSNIKNPIPAKKENISK
jgi:hypothetical protein